MKRLENGIYYNKRILKDSQQMVMKSGNYKIN